VSRSNRAPVRSTVAAAICAVVLGGCSYNWTSVIPAGPSVIPHRDSAVVTIAIHSEHREMHHESASFWSPERYSVVREEVVVDRYEDLDVRTCKVSLRWRAPAGPEPDGSDVPRAERAMMGPLRFYVGDDRTSLVVANAATAQTWTAANGFAQIDEVIAVPAARRVVVISAGGSIAVYDVDANRVIACTTV